MIRLGFFCSTQQNSGHELSDLNLESETEVEDDENPELTQLMLTQLKFHLSQSLKLKMMRILMLTQLKFQVGN